MTTSQELGTVCTIIHYFYEPVDFSNLWRADGLDQDEGIQSAFRIWSEHVGTAVDRSFSFYTKMIRWDFSRMVYLCLTRDGASCWNRKLLQVTHRWNLIGMVLIHHLRKSSVFSHGSKNDRCGGFSLFTGDWNLCHGIWVTAPMAEFEESFWCFLGMEEDQAG